MRVLARLARLAHPLRAFGKNLRAFCAPLEKKCARLLHVFRKKVRAFCAPFEKCERLWENARAFGKMCATLGKCTRLLENISAPLAKMCVHFVNITRAIHGICCI